MSLSLLLLVVLGAVPSLVLLLMLGSRDPKRLRNLPRNARESVTPWPPARRRLIGALAILPGLLMMLTGEWAAFLIWLGLCLCSGWLWVHRLAPPAIGATMSRD